MAKRSFHIVPHDKGWALKEGGTQDPLGIYGTQREAIDEGRAKAVDDEDEIDLVIHRADGRIRERLKYEEVANTVSTTTATAGTATNANGSNAARAARGTRVGRAPVQPEDVIPVGNRVSWAALLAGVTVALTTYITLSVLGAAVGLSVYNEVSDEALSYGAVIWAGVSWLVSLFLGGYVVSRTTTGETKGEAAIYGVLLWGATMLALALLGASFSEYGLGNLLSRVHNPALNETHPVTANATAIAWLTFASIVLSLLTAVAGALVGAGPRFVFLDRPAGEPASVKG